MIERSFVINPYADAEVEAHCKVIVSARMIALRRLEIEKEYIVFDLRFIQVCAPLRLFKEGQVSHSRAITEVHSLFVTNAIVIHKIIVSRRTTFVNRT